MSFSSIYTSLIPNQNCAICFDLANESRRYAVHIPDSVDPQKIQDVAEYHILHLSCMEEHLQKSENKSCPTCRAPIPQTFQNALMNRPTLPTFSNEKAIPPHQIGEALQAEASEGRHQLFDSLQAKNALTLEYRGQALIGAASFGNLQLLQKYSLVERLEQIIRESL